MSPASPVLAAVFDLDDCLVDTAGAFAAWSQCFADAHGVPVDEVRAVNALHAGLRHAFFADLRDRYTLKATITKLHADYRRDCAELTPYRPEVCRMIRALSDTGWRMAVLTNGSPDAQWIKLRRSGLHRFFPRHRVVISGDYGPRKPDRQLFDIALDSLRARTAAMVGDSLEDDIAGGGAAGLHTVWVSHGQPLQRGGARPDRVVATVTEAAHYLLTTTDLSMPIPA
ncbi:HAD family hydrolase [Streptomyces sp. NPDC001407]|uniref:HAD family hydrolase n=1 Tax=Streptomyces sp. NPDC001407 TaxID=3364573 RepID=UPI0036CFBED0